MRRECAHWARPPHPVAGTEVALGAVCRNPPGVEPPSALHPQLVERFRQIHPFDEAERHLVERLVAQPTRLPRREEWLLRLALNMARLWILPTAQSEVVVGPKLGAYRAEATKLAHRIMKTEDPATLGPDAHLIRPVLEDARRTLLADAGPTVTTADLDRELGTKVLALAVGGGGGCGYVHLGTFSVLESLQIRPALLVGASMGSVLSLFRARTAEYLDSTIDSVTGGVTFRKLFRILEHPNNFGMPGTLRLYLRSAFSKYFLGPEGHPLTLSDLHIPFICVVTGVRSEAARALGSMDGLFRVLTESQPWRRLMQLKSLMQQAAGILAKLVAMPDGLVPIALGHDPSSRAFDALDAVGFSSAVPGLIQYDLNPDDQRMHDLVHAVAETHQVQYLADGGLTANVPARFTWEAIQLGRLGTRNAFIMALDCFHPQLRRNIMFAPIQRLAAENTQRDRPFAQRSFRYQRVPSPLALVPSRDNVHAALENGRNEFVQEIPYLLKMLERLPPITEV